MTVELISDITLMIQGHLGGYFQGQKVNLRVKITKKLILVNTNKNKCNTSFVCEFDYRILFWYYFDDSMSFLKSKGRYEGQINETMISTNKTYYD